jgi:hypothetical protein
MADTMKLPSLTEDQARWVEVWVKAEDVAMHFNDLIMNYRLKAIGSVAVAAGLVGSVLLTKGADAPTRSSWGVFGGAMGFLGIVWAALAIIDMLYYQRLLLGAVDEARRLEQQSGEVLQLSKQIEATANRGMYAVSGWLFYALPFAAICVVFGIGVRHACG